MVRTALKALVLCAAFLAIRGHAAELPAQSARFISQLSIKNGHLAWQKVRPGQSQREVEKLLGGKLVLRPTATPGQGAYTHVATVTRDGLSVQLGFYKQAGQSVLAEIAVVQPNLAKAQVASLRKTAKDQLKGLRDSGADFPLTSSGGDELDISEYALRLQIGSDGD